MQWYKNGRDCQAIGIIGILRMMYLKFVLCALYPSLLLFAQSIVCTCCWSCYIFIYTRNGKMVYIVMASTLPRATVFLMLIHPYTPLLCLGCAECNTQRKAEQNEKKRKEKKTIKQGFAEKVIETERTIFVELLLLFAIHFACISDRTTIIERQLYAHDNFHRKNDKRNRNEPQNTI